MGFGFSDHKPLILLILLCGLLYFPGLGQRDFWNPDEPRFALVAKEMLESGQYLIPQRNQQPYLKKPPLYFWSVCFFAGLSGGVGETVARLPSALAGMGMVIATFLLGRAVLGQAAGLWAALILATVSKLYWQARFVQVDALFSFWMTVAVFCLYWAWERPDRAWRFSLAGFFAAGAAMLTKGPLALVLLFLAGVPYVIYWQVSLKERVSFKKLLPFLVGAALCLGLAVPWYLLAMQKAGSQFAQQNLWRENLARFFNGFDHINPFYHYLLTLPADFFPWTLLLPGGVLVLWQERRVHGKTGRFAWFLIFWLGLSFLFFSASQSKQGKYLLPLFPGFALAVGWFCSMAEQKASEPWKSKALSLLLMFTSFVPILGAFIAYLYLHQKYFDLIPHFAPPAVVLMAGGIAVMFLCHYGHLEKGLGILVGTYGIGYLAVSLVTLPAINEYKSARPVCEMLAGQLRAEDRVAYWGSASTNNAYVYYTGRPLEELGADRQALEYMRKPGRAFLFVRKQRYDQLSARDKATWALVNQKRVGHRHMMLFCNRIIGGNP